MKNKIICFTAAIFLFLYGLTTDTIPTFIDNAIAILNGVLMILEVLKKTKI